MEKVWLKNYPAGVPTEIDADQYTSLLEIFEKSCAEFPNRIAYYSLGGDLTFSQWQKQSYALAAYLQKALSLQKGERLAIMLPNVMQYPVAIMAAFYAGLTVVNVNPLYTVPELAHLLMDSEATTILTLTNFAHTVQGAMPQSKLKHVLITQLGDFLLPPKSWLTNFVVRLKKMVPKWNIPHAIYLKTALKQGRGLTLDRADLSHKDIAFLQYTGGTTGVSKGAMLTHRNMVANVLQATAWVKPAIPSGNFTILAPLPLYHIFSLTANCLTFMHYGAANLLITNPRDISGLIKTWRRYRVTGITGVNTLFNALLSHPDFAKLDFRDLRFCLGGGAQVQTSVSERWQKITGSVLYEAYGLTETSPAVAINPFSVANRMGSVGLPVPSTSIRIVDEQNQEVGFNRSGELCIKGPQVMAGYWKNPSETAQVLSPDGWLRTGDIATVDPQGFVHIVDRKKDLIDVSGFKVFPNEVEDVIAKHPDVLEVAVVGIPDSHSGEAVKAYIVSKNPSLDLETIRRFCKQHLTSYKIPHYVEFCASLPKSNVGKILRRELRHSK